MSIPENPADTPQAASLAAALIARIGPLADAAARAREGIASDRDRHTVSGEADALIGTVIGRVDEIEGDLRRLMRILHGFEAAAATEPVEPEPDSAVASPPAVEPEPASAVTPPPEASTEPAESPAAEGLPGIVTFPGAPAPAPEVAEPPSGEPVAAEPPTAGERQAAEPPPAGEPAVAEPPSREPVAALPADEDLAMPPPAGAPVSVPAEDEATETPAAPVPEEPIHISEGVRLLATQMSVAGASTSDIARRLHNDFGVEDADRLIAHLFGSGSTPR